MMTALSRRSFLTVAGTAAVAARPAERIPVGAHPWVYAAPRPQNDITGVLDEIFADFSAAGMEFIELMHTALLPGDAVERIGALSERHRLPVLGASYSAPMFRREEHARILDEAGLVAERLQKLSARTLGATVGSANRRKTTEELDAQAEVLRRMTGIFSQRGITINLHNHSYEVAEQEYDLAGTLQRVPDSKLGPDIDWLINAGVDPIDFLRRHRSRIVYAHLRDRDAKGVWTEALGEGVVDFAGVARTLREIGFSGQLAIELAHPRGFQLTRPLRESLRISREHVRRVMGF